MLKYLLNYQPPTDARLHLFTNDITPSETNIIGDFTEPITVPGYSSIILPGSAWTFSTTSGTSTATFARQTFTFSTSVVVRGYYLTNSASTELLLAEKFTGAVYNIATSGGYIEIDPSISLD